MPRHTAGANGRTTAVHRPANDPPRIRPAWAQPIDQYAAEAGIDAEVYYTAAVALGCWWLKNSTTAISRPDAERIEALIGQLGLSPFVQPYGAHEPAPASSVTATPADSPDQPFGTDQTPSSDQLSAARIADIDRVVALVDDHRERLAGRFGRWLLGDVMLIMWDSTPTRRVLKERGILLSDIRTAITRAVGERAAIPADRALTSTAITELKRMHRARLAFLHVAEADSTAPRLTMRARDQRVPVTRGERVRRADTSAALEVGQIAWVAVEENDRGQRSTKRHPAVLMARTGRRNDRWIILTMTSEVDDDAERRSVPRANELGLEYGGYVWHETTKVYKSQIERAVGWVHHDLIRVIDRVIGLRQSMRADLEKAADAHHGH